MPEAKTYVKEELGQKVPQKIISHFQMTNIEKTENVLAVFGSVSFIGIFSSVLSTEDRLIYLNNSSLKPITIVVLYTDIAGIELKSEKDGNYIYLSLADGESIEIDIKAPNEDVAKLFEFIKGYKETGASYINNRIISDENYARRIEAIGKNINEKIINNNEKIDENERKYKERVAAIQRETDEKANRIGSSRSSANYKLDYCNGLGANFPSGPAKILMDNIHKFMEIEVQKYAPVKIPYANIKGSSITTDVEIPTDDLRNEYMFYLNVTCTINGIDTILVFSKMQKQNSTIDAIKQLNYAIAHLEENSTKKEKLLAEIQQKHAERLEAIQRETDEKANRIGSSRSSANYRLDYCNGLGANFPTGPAKILMDNIHKFMEIEVQKYAPVKIPYANIKGSSITTDVEIPTDDIKNEYMFYLNITCTINGIDTVLVFSKMQKQNSTIDAIKQLNYAIAHLEENSSKYEKDLQRENELRVEREELIAKRADQIQQFKAVFRQDSNNNDQQEPLQSIGSSSTQFSPNNFDEIKKFKELLDSGIITQEEFDAKKKELLGL